MKKILYGLFLCLSFVLSSCDETTQDNSKVTYFVDLNIEGDATLFWPIGTPYQDPGYTAIMDGQDVSSDVKITGTVNTNEAGIYNITYSAMNADGFSSEQSRTVFVYDPTPSAMESGYYTTSKNSTRSYNGAIVSYGRDYAISIFQVEPGIFYTTDFLGGWYDQRAGYGGAYAMVGYFELNEDNTITPLESYVAGWGDEMNGMTGSFNPETQTITWAIDYTGNHMIFNCTITKS